MTDNEIKMMQLKNYQAMPLFNAKINRSGILIREAYEYWDGQMYIALSGGKDSWVLAKLVWSIYPNVPAVFVDTGNELESIREFISQKIAEGYPIEIIKPAMTFWEVNKKYGWPILSKQICMGIDRFCKTKSFTQKRLRAFGGINPSSGKKQQRTIPKKFHYILRLVLKGKLKVTTKCCGELKIKPFVIYNKRTGRHPFVGTMASDSETRKNSYMKNGCNAFKDGKGESRPMMFWTEQDVLEYTFKRGIGISKAYGEIVHDIGGGFKCTKADRTGCKFCLFGIHMEKGWNRIQRLAVEEPDSWVEFVEGGGDEIMDTLKREWRPIDTQGE